VIAPALAGLVDVGPPSILEMAKACQSHPQLRDRESDFVNAMLLLAAGGRYPSPKQVKWLRDIHKRIKQQ
jgi:hypothetical protein